LDIYNQAGLIQMSKHSTSQKAGGKTVGKAFFAKALQIAHDGVIALDETQNVLFFNDGAERIFGYTASEVINQPLDMLLPPHLVETTASIFAISPHHRTRAENGRTARSRRKTQGWHHISSHGEYCQSLQRREDHLHRHLNDITDQKEPNKGLKTRSNTWRRCTPLTLPLPVTLAWTRC